MESNKPSSLRRFFVGSIRRKLLLSFGFLIVLMVLLSVSTYYLNNELRNLTFEIREVSAPMDMMVEQVIGYDAMLTGNAHAALLHAIQNEYAAVAEHQVEYDEIGVKMDNLLKKDYVALLEKSSMPIEIKNKEMHLLGELDKVNLALVDLEVGAFDAMHRGDVNAAFGLIVGETYSSYKEELSSLYASLSETQTAYTQSVRAHAASVTSLMDSINVFFAALIIIIGIIVMFYAAGSISKPIQELHFAVKEINKGNFDAKVDIKTHDELAELGATLNSTSSALSATEIKRKEIDHMKTEFLSITSHELRSPMTPMRAQLQMLLGGYFGKLNSKQKESAEIVLRNTERLDHIIQDFLEISRIEAARLKFNFVKTTLEEPIKRVVEETKSFAPEKNISYELTMGKLPSFEVDSDRVMQVLRNLLNNATKFTPENGKVIVVVQPKANELLFSVKDTGIGIAEENKARIFEPFFQEEQSMYRKYGGTGLGLAICRGIIESQGGRIWFESEKGKGTTFHFTVPFVPLTDIKPIKILFSQRGEVEEKLKSALIDFLGPLGEKEFVELNRGGISEKEVMDYIDYLAKNKILRETGEFKKKVRLIFGEKSV